MTTLALDDVSWHSFVHSHPDATVFHHPAWAGLLADCYGYEASVCAVPGDGGDIAAAAPLMFVKSRLTGRRAVSLPFTDFCPPLVTDRAALGDLMRALEERRRAEDWPKLEIRWDLGDLARAGETCLRHVTPLGDDADAVIKTFNKSRVRGARKARDAGVTIRRSWAWDDVDAFYRLHLGTRRRQGVPTQPRRFFRLLWERVLARGLGFVLVAEHDGAPIAAAVFLRFNGTLIYKYGASDEDSWNLRPNNLLFLEAITAGCEVGDRVFDWGRTDVGHEGLADFKRGWGAEEQTVTYGVLGDASAGGGTPGGGIVKNVIQKSPAWVSRAVGEALYGHFG